MSIRQDAQAIIDAALSAAQPDRAVRRALQDFQPSPEGRVILVSIGKAGYQMAKAAAEALGPRIDRGIVITKHGHAEGPIPGLLIREGGHPLPDEQGLQATEEALQLTEDLRAEDSVLLLISGGGSALFELPLVTLDELSDITQQLLKSGADIVAINTIRKRLSRVKGGRFAAHCAPAGVFAIILSDVLGDPLDMIASGPVSPDLSTSADALAAVSRYGLQLSGEAMALLKQDTPKALSNVETRIAGNLRLLCDAAARKADELGYQPLVLTDSLDCQAREAGSFLAAIARSHAEDGRSLAFIAGGETVVKLTGTGKGGRNQELALSAAAGIQGLPGCAVFSLGSDGTDGPTDAAGGYVDGDTAGRLAALHINLHEALDNNDSYPTLKAVDGLLMTGPTGTNVNDLSVLLIKR